eukprot:11542275-Karenia_brevis.AAC.1
MWLDFKKTQKELAPRKLLRKAEDFVKHEVLRTAVNTVVRIKWSTKELCMQSATCPEVPVAHVGKDL